MNKFVATFLLLWAVSSLTIDCDNYLSIGQQGYQFKVINSQPPVTFTASGLPSGLTFQGNSLIVTGKVTPGQYIIGVKASDTTNKSDEKIIIMNIPTALAPSAASQINNIQATPGQIQVNTQSVQTLTQIQTGQTTSSSQSSSAGSQSPSSAQIYLPPVSTKPTQTSGSTTSSSISNSNTVTGSVIGQIPIIPITGSSVSSNTVNAASISFSTPNDINFGITTQTNSADGNIASNTAGSVESLNSYFSQLGVSGAATQSVTQSSVATNNAINDLLTDYSNTTITPPPLQTFNSSVDSNYQLKSLVNLGVTTTQAEQAAINTQAANKIFAQQKLAAQYVASNFSLVQQITANKILANQMIVNITKKYQQDEAQQAQIYQAVNDATIYKSKITSAIANLNGLINNLNSQIVNETSKKNTLITQKAQVLIQNNQTGYSVSQITSNIAILQGQIKQTTSTLNQNTNQCSSIDSNLQATNKSINIYTLQQGLVTQQLAASNNDVITYQARVDDLMKQLAAAQQLLANAQKNVTTLKQTQTNLTNSMAQANLNVGLLSQNLASCKVTAGTIQKNLAELQASLLGNQTALAQSNSQGTQQQNIIAGYDLQISQQDNVIANIKGQIANATASINTLQNALPNATNALNVALQQKSQIDQQVQNDADGLNAAIVRYKTESANLDLATMNLQNARAISTQADQAVNQLMASKGNILPYAIAVNTTNPLIGQTIVSPTVNISNWFNYLSANFGRVSSIYSSAAISALYGFTCGANLNNIGSANDNQLNTITGRIIAINSKTELVVSVDGGNGNQIVQIPSSALLYSNVPNYTFTAGDSIIIKGSSTDLNTMVVKSLICISQ